MNPTLGTILLCILGFGLITGLILLIYSFLEASNLKIDIQDIYPSTRTSEKKEDSSSKASEVSEASDASEVIDGAVVTASDSLPDEGMLVLTAVFCSVL